MCGPVPIRNTTFRIAGFGRRVELDYQSRQFAGRNGSAPKLGGDCDESPIHLRLEQVYLAFVRSFLQERVSCPNRPVAHAQVIGSFSADPNGIAARSPGGDVVFTPLTRQLITPEQFL